MSQTLGEKLRKAREEKGISISEVAEQTRISPLYLDAIDADNFKPLPGGIFNKGFIRSYAKYVGVDEQEALDDYKRMSAASETAEQEKLSSYRPEVLTDDRTGSSIVPTVIFAVIILALMTAGILFLVDYIQNQQTEPILTSANTAANNSNNSTQTAPTPEPSSNQAPNMETLRVEFKTSGDNISLNSVADGVGKVSLVTSSEPAIFEPKQQLKLSYSRSLAQLAQLHINGKPISLPQTPANPRRAVIEFDINSSNLESLWQSGAISFEQPSAVENAPAVAPKPIAKPARTPAADGTPANVSPSAAQPPAAPKASPSPIIVGRPPANGGARSN